MLSITPISAGAAGVDYLLRQSGCREGERSTEERHPEPSDPENEERELGAEGSAGPAESGADYLLRSREADGSVRWWGSGTDDVGVDRSAAPRDDEVRAVFGRLEHASTGEPLGSPPRRYLSAEERIERALAAEPDATPERRTEIEWRVRGSQRKAVGYYDLTFSPAKSVSVLYAALSVAGRREEAEQVGAAHRAGVDAAMKYLQEEAGYSRAGYHGRAKDGRSVGEYVAARTWTAVEFDHSTSRAGDPQLHTHVAVLNRVRCEGDAEWRTVDSRGLYRARAAAGAAYERTYEEALNRALSVEFAMRPDGKAREIHAIPPEVRDAFSQRRSEVVAAVGDFIADYTERHGRPPSPYDVTVAAQHAARSTRQLKQDVPAEDLERSWSLRLEGVLDGVDAAREAPEHQDLPRWNRDRVIAAAVHRVQSARATWTHYDLLAALNAELPAGLGLEPAEHHELLESLATDGEGLGAGVVALTPGEVVPTPAALRRDSDGRPRFRPHRDERFATLDQLDAEERLLGLTRTGGAPMLIDETLGALDAELDALGLDPHQRAAVIGILGSSRRADALIGPAGTGKSLTMAALTAAWAESHGTPAIGVATSQAAADVLADDGVAAVNVARFLQRHEPRPDGRAAEPLPYGCLLIVDEAGMSATDQLDRVRALMEAAHGKIVLTGDDKQLGPVGAGGVLAHLARAHPEDVPAPGGPVFRLAEPRRFRESWEGEASLGLRRGDVAALQTYDDHGRVRAGHADTVVEKATSAYLADTLAGQRSLLITATNGQAADIAGQIRTQLIRLGHVEPDADPAVLRDGNTASRGDLVQTRRNMWVPDQMAGPARPVVNREVWRVERRLADGSLVVDPADGRDGPRVVLDPEYVGAHLTLAYAGTVHSAQGRTVDTAHTLVDSATTRDAFYVAMTRGARSNTAWVTTAAEVDDDQYVEPLRADYMEVLTDVLERERDDRTATEVLADETDHSESLLALGVVWSGVGAEYRRDINTDRLLNHVGPEATEALVDEPGFGRLLRAMHEIEIDGHDPDDLLDEAVGRSELSSARSMSHVLRWRLRQAAEERVAEPRGSTWADRTPRGDDKIAGYLAGVAAEMDRRQERLGELAAAEPPPWAQQHLGEVPDDPLARAEWSGRAGAVAAYHELYAPQRDGLGPAPSRENPEARAAWVRAYEALGAPEALRDYSAATDEELKALVAAYEREETWAPLHVADVLRETRQRVADYTTRAELAQAEAAVAPGDEERSALLQRAESHRAFVQWQADRAEKLELIHDARARWHDETAESREKASRARRELHEREVPLEADQGEAPPVARTDPPCEPEWVEREPQPEPVNAAEEERRPEPGPSGEPAPHEDDLDGAVARAREALELLQRRGASHAAVEERAPSVAEPEPDREPDRA
ncbi:MobF family relaxase [Actinomycetospora chibensis]|uniref:MobF family relaxase n=1 Tax=Actinomycetospora chibensis TaxID=663606 RepID=A0ABV9REG5_9PSEU|nr:MobF family relaxase [Actinomycetospora chibensis]MDD7925035.1 MobF family relaxase [Actinomycetospora chibensis]